MNMVNMDIPIYTAMFNEEYVYFDEIIKILNRQRGHLGCGDMMCWLHM